ncbi:FUSC family protein [Kitasatospora sp. NPDC059571]|uniref:FUSC family protein n=1 Tax=Kitasatospora sp. NPDC059571 TaxID=3346871 RepID=UPI0036C55A34
MPGSRPPVRAVTGNGRRRAVAGVASALSPRGALVLHRVDGALGFALRAALAMALTALPLVLAGRPEVAVYAMLGSFTTTFGRNLSYPRRARVLALVAVAMTACVACGSALAAWLDPRAGGSGAAVAVVATAVVAGLAKFACDATGLGGLGAVLLLFSFAVAANAAAEPGDVLPRTALAAMGAAVAWLLAMAGRLLHPDRPQRLVVAAALRETADVVEATVADGPDGRAGGVRGRPGRHRATAAVLQAYHCLGLMPPTADRPGAVRGPGGAGPDGSGEVCAVLTDLSWSLLIRSARRPAAEPAVLAGHLRRQVGLLVDRRRRPPVVLPELTLPPPVPPPGAAPGTTGPRTADPAGRRAAELVVQRPARRVSVLLVPALRMALGAGVAGGLAVLLGLGHGYWAAISAAAVLHSVNVRTTAQRAVQRTLGTLAGLLIAFGVLAAQPGPNVLVLAIVLLEFLLEYVVVRNYGLGVVFLTPLALLLSDLAFPAPAESLVRDRLLASLLGIAVGLLCALLVVHDRAAVRVDRALAACTEAADRAERALADRAESAFPVVQVQLAAAVVELREADDAAAGELWPAGIDPAALAAAERRAYVLLERFGRPG